ncbi:hypothetical protein niasHT_015007 [Heterodera trifolii]|uniref:Lon proteolytic domain-containing protein n=1 Tax=Heterodera trifolii TaxID=157864 RepID=A0ABD2L0Y1_9BILA
MGRKLHKYPGLAAVDWKQGRKKWKTGEVFKLEIEARMGPQRFTLEAKTTRDTRAAMRTAYNLACEMVPDFFQQRSIVMKMVPFDMFTGPSSSPVAFAALVAMATGRRIWKNAIATGHLMDDGTIGPVGDIYLKVGAAARAKRYKMAMPEANRGDFTRICCLRKRKMKAVFVSTKEQLLNALLH